MKLVLYCKYRMYMQKIANFSDLSILQGSIYKFCEELSLLVRLLQYRKYSF